MGRVRLGRWSRGHRRRSRNPQRAGGPGGNPPAFGASCVYEETSTPSSTTNTVTYVTHLTMNTPVLPAGDYLLGAWVEYQQSNDFEGDCQLRLVLDGAPIADERGNTDGQGIGGANAAGNQFQDVRLLTFATMASHVIEVQFRVGAPSAAGDIAGLYWSALELWSFN